MLKQLKTLGVFCACTLGMMTLSANAFADCKTMNDDEWNELTAQMNSAYSAGDYDGALNYGKRLNLICPRSPVVNYTMSAIYRKVGNEKDAAVYAKKATDYITDYPVSQAVAERIWLNRAEYELPYKADLEALQAKTADYDDMKVNYEALLAAQNEANIRSEYESTNRALQDEKMYNDNLKAWKAVMWTGVGVTGVGIALAITGGVMSTNVDKIEYSTPEAGSSKSGFSITKKYVTSYALLGAGVGLAVVGAAFTGVGAYKVISLDINRDGVSDESVSFNIAPTSVQFGMTF